tara:strand:- start:3884 stop:4729 length:846 start_codon:yes stop_codon:yes gene_type:complete
MNTEEPSAVSSGGMLAAARRDAISQLVAEQGALSVGALATRFGVSEMTVRRDLNQLQRSGAIQRAHGGAVRVPVVVPVPAMTEPTFNARRQWNSDAKARIAEAATGFVGERDVIGLDVGSTATELAELLLARTDISVITHNLQAVATLARSETGPKMYVIGGHYRRNEGSLCSPEASNELRRFSLNTAFIGVAGITPEGLFDYSPEEADIKNLYADRAQRTCILCDSSKFGRRALVRFSGLDAIDILITDQAPRGELAAALADNKVQVIVASAPTSLKQSS